MPTVFVLLPTNCVDFNMTMDASNELLFDLGQFGQVVWNISQVQVVFRREEVGVTRKLGIVTVTASATNPVDEDNIEPLFAAAGTLDHNLGIQSSIELPEATGVLGVDGHGIPVTSVVDILKWWIFLGKELPASLMSSSKCS